MEWRTQETASFRGGKCIDVHTGGVLHVFKCEGSFRGILCVLKCEGSFRGKDQGQKRSLITKRYLYFVTSGMSINRVPNSLI